MTNEKKFWLVTLIVVATIAIGFAVKAILSLISNTNKSQPKQQTQPNSNDATKNPEIGRIAYANSDGVIVTDSDFNIYKIAKKDEWVGTVYSVGDVNYGVSGNRYVLKGDVYLK